MRKILLASLLLGITPFALIFGLIILISIHNQSSNISIHGGNVAYAALPSTQGVLSATIEESAGGNAEKIRQFLARYNSPLEPYSEDIVNAADEYGLDHRLIVGIAMQESGLCKHIPENSYNCWGFGIYTGHTTRFADYKEGIYTVTKALATRYKARGLVTVNQIMSMYTPSSNGSWARGVNHTISQLQ